jgi:hypothetical protein
MRKIILIILAACAWSLEADASRLEQLDQSRAADPEEIGCFLRREELIDGRNRDCLALAHRSSDRDEHAEGLEWQRHRLTVRPYQGRRLRVSIEEACQVEHRLEILRGQDCLTHCVRAHATSVDQNRKIRKSLLSAYNSSKNSSSRS